MYRFIIEDYFSKSRENIPDCLLSLAININKLRTYLKEQKNPTIFKLKTISVKPMKKDENVNSPQDEQTNSNNLKEATKIQNNDLNENIDLVTIIYALNCFAFSLLFLLIAVCNSTIWLMISS
jgi:hypothetical protein